MAIQLMLEPSKRLPRRLRLTLTANGRNLSARVFVAEHETTFSSGRLEDWYLDSNASALWHHSSSFNLTAEEVARVRKLFGPHGLIPFPAAAPIGPESAKVAARVPLPPRARGTTPPANCAGGALESEASVLAYALINGEVY